MSLSPRVPAGILASALILSLGAFGPSSAAAVSSAVAASTVPAWHARVCSIEAGTTLASSSLQRLGSASAGIRAGEGTDASLSVQAVSYQVVGTGRRCDLVVATTSARRPGPLFGAFSVRTSHFGQSWSEDGGIIYADPGPGRVVQEGQHLFSRFPRSFRGNAGVVPARTAVVVAEVYEPVVTSTDPETGRRWESHHSSASWSVSTTMRNTEISTRPASAREKRIARKKLKSALREAHRRPTAAAERRARAKARARYAVAVGPQKVATVTWVPRNGRGSVPPYFDSTPPDWYVPLCRATQGEQPCQGYWEDPTEEPTRAPE